jgi:hypothetical protein
MSCVMKVDAFSQVVPGLEAEINSLTVSALGVGDHSGWDRISEESPEWPNAEMRTTNCLEGRVVAPLAGSNPTAVLARAFDPQLRLASQARKDRAGPPPV